MITDERIGAHKFICPHSGKPIFLWEMFLGNSFNQRIWPDSRHEYLMMARPSVIQKCEHCNHYFHTKNSKYEYVSESTVMSSLEEDVQAADGIGNHLDNKTRILLKIEKLTEFKNALQEAKNNRCGKLSVAQLYDAYGDIVTETASSDQIQDYLLMYIWAYTAPKALHNDNINSHALECAKKLISILGDNNPLTAELYRVFGRFEKSIEICQILLEESTEPDVVKEIMDKSILHDTDMIVFSQA